VKIIGSPDIFVQSGTSVDVKCQITDSSSSSSSSSGRSDSSRGGQHQHQQLLGAQNKSYEQKGPVVFWFRNGRRILPNEDDAVFPITSERLRQDVLVQALQIRYARRADAGNYTCALADGSSDTVILHVLDGE
jgi:hypothetical protein